MTQESLYLGQFIPLQYHYNMLNDVNRMTAFKVAIERAVQPEARVLELGGGTGVLSFFASRRASKVWCVERNPELTREAKRILALNPGSEKIEVIEADASEYLPPEPVDVLICEMLHAGMLREKQIQVISFFKKRYIERFHTPLPLFVPEASILAAQPVQQSFDFLGYYAPTIFFQNPYGEQEETIGLGDPFVYQIVQYSENFPEQFSWDGTVTVKTPGLLNALRFVTKNILLVLVAEKNTVDWNNQHLIVPLPEPVKVEKGDKVHVKFSYSSGAQLEALRGSISVSRF
jgi:protein arginine N-methyltransferase 1